MPNQVSRSSQSWIAREIAAGSLKAIGYQVTITYVLPLGLTLVTALTGYLQGLPWMYILVGTALMFAGVTTGLVRFDEWVERRRVKGKLTLSGVNAARDVRGPGLVFGVTLANEAAVPIEFRTQTSHDPSSWPRLV